MIPGYRIAAQEFDMLWGSPKWGVAIDNDKPGNEHWRVAVMVPHEGQTKGRAIEQCLPVLREWAEQHDT